MPSTSPSPSKRPSLAERSSSTHSLSSSGRPSNANAIANANKAHKVHVVSKHQRNVSHGKGLNKLGKIASNANIAAEGKPQRKKSGPVTPAGSPRTPVLQNFKRNSSHAGLPKNTSNANLRKNHSAGALSSKRNRSHGTLSKLGAPPSQKAKEDEEKKQGFFALGDQSSEEDDEEEWEDSATQSPEMSRNQSKASTPLRPRTPNNESQKPPDSKLITEIKPADIPEPPVKENTRPAPTPKQPPTDEPPTEPALLQTRSRSSRAPPAMSTASVQVGPGSIPRSDSARSLSTGPADPAKTPNMNNSTQIIGTASSGSGGVSHFLQASSVATSAKTFDTGSDEESVTGFMSNYKPQQSDSPEKPRSMLNKIQSRAAPSRTNQKMELQRREMMRAGAATAATPGPGALGINAGSTVSLHSRSGSKGGVRNRSLAGEMKALKQDYESAIKQLTVVRRFRNPVLESLHRLQENDVIPLDVGSKSLASSQTKSRPQSRRGITASSTNTPKVGMARSPEDRKVASRSNSQVRHSRVQFQLSRQGSHDDIGLTTSQGSSGEFDDEQDGVSPEEALIRRIWESRVVYENDGVQTTG